MESTRHLDDAGIRVTISSHVSPIPNRTDVQDRKRYMNALIQSKRIRKENGFKRLSQQSIALTANTSRVNSVMTAGSSRDDHESTQSRIYRDNSHLMDFARGIHSDQHDELNHEDATLQDTTWLSALVSPESAESQANEPWIRLDSAAEEHGFRDRDMFLNLEAIAPRQVAGLGSAIVTEAGSVEMTLTAPGGGTTSLYLENVLFVPDLAFNLVSIGRLEDVGIDCDLFRRQMWQNGNLLSTIQKQGTIYRVPFTQPAESGANVKTVAGVTPQDNLRPLEYYSQPLPSHRTLQRHAVLKDLSRRFTGRSDRVLHRVPVASSIISAGLALPAPPDDSVARAREDIITTLRERLIDSGLPAGQTLDIRLLHWILPSTRIQADIWKILLESPITTSDGLVDQVFSLRLSTAGSPRPDPHHIVYYLRTYAYTSQELLRVLRSMQQQDYDLSEQAQSWLNNLDLDTRHEEEEDEVAFYYIRYVGQTKGQRGYDRMIQDRSNAPAFGRTFLRHTERYFPDVIRDCKIQEFSSATIEVPNIDPRVADLREQVIIHIFNQGLLNVATGGTRLDFRPSSEDETAFVLLRTRVTTRLSELIRCPEQVESDINAYVEACRTYTEKNPDSTGTSDEQFRITTAISAIQLEQAIPRVFKNQSTHCTPFCLLGSGYPKTFASNIKPWVLQKTTSADILRFAINYCGSWELPLGIVDDELARKLHNAGNIPHFDGFPWYDTWGSESDLGPVSDFSREYLQAARPLVVICFSPKVYYILVCQLHVLIKPDVQSCNQQLPK